MSDAKKSGITVTFIEATRKKMLVFAKSQLANTECAQDAVQEALTAALTHQHEFKGNAMFKTWVFAILKNKIADQIRKNSRYVSVTQIRDTNKNADTNSADTNSSDEEFMSTLFNDVGHWHKNDIPQAFDNSWNSPNATAYSQDFWRVLETCLAALPAEQSRAFLMKEYIELETETICQEMGISHSNYYTLMHRARLRLQKCLNIRWFDNVQ